MWWTKPSTARRALLLAAAAASLGGCITGQTGPRGAAPAATNAPTALDQFPIGVSPRPEELALAPHASGLSPAQRDALAVYAAAWRESGSAVITVSVPFATTGCRCDAHVSAQAAASELSRLGVPPGLLRLTEYDAAGRPDAPVFARYTRYVASVDDCRDHWSNLVSTYDNSAPAHFGCAGSQNLAAEIADARDLMRPAPSDPADGMRRATVLDKYRKGQTTSSAKDDQAAGAISNAVH